MGRKPNQWSRVEDADEIIKKLFEKHPAILWAVKPECIAVWGIENKEKSEKNHTLAKIKPIKGVEKAIFQDKAIPTRYVIEMYWSDWNKWGPKLKKAVLFHELLHVHPDYEKTVKHDCEDFRIVLDKFGVDWQAKEEELPDLINDDVKFNIDLRPKVDDYDEEDNDEITDGIKEDEDDPKKVKKSRKGKKTKDAESEDDAEKEFLDAVEDTKEVEDEKGAEDTEDGEDGEETEEK